MSGLGKKRSQSPECGLLRMVKPIQMNAKTKSRHRFTKHSYFHRPMRVFELDIETPLGEDPQALQIYDNRFDMRPTRLSILALWLACSSLSALDLATIPENDSKALQTAIESEGGETKGEPYVATAVGPDGTPQRVITFPSPDSYVDLPISPESNFWTMTGAIQIDELPFAKSGGAMFGVLFGKNDSVLAISANKWSKVSAPQLMSGANTLIEDLVFQEAGVPQTGGWQKIVLHLDGEDWKLQIGDSFNKSGTILEDTRGALKRRTALSMRIGTFTGTATLPAFSGSE